MVQGRFSVGLGFGASSCTPGYAADSKSERRYINFGRWRVVQTVGGRSNLVGMCGVAPFCRGCWRVVRTGSSWLLAQTVGQSCFREPFGGWDVLWLARSFRADRGDVVVVDFVRRDFIVGVFVCRDGFVVD